MRIETAANLAEIEAMFAEIERQQNVDTRTGRTLQARYPGWDIIGERIEVGDTIVACLGKWLKV